MNQLKLKFDHSLNEPTPYLSKYDFNPGSTITPFNGETGTTVLPVWNTYNGMAFNGTARIESHADVAQILKGLESKGIEHAFAVHVNEDKKPLIQMVSIGSRAAALFETAPVLAAAHAFKSKEIYLVHNHPSGDLTPSTADFNLTKTFQDSFKYLEIDVSHVILNTYNNKYTLLKDGLFMTYNHKSENQIDPIKYEAHIFDGQKVLSEPLSMQKLTDADQVAKAIQGLRFSAFPKAGMLVVDNKISPIANYFLNDFNLKNIVNLIAPLPRWRGILTYSNTDQSEALQELPEKLKGFGIQLFDHIQFNSNSNGVKGAYISYQNEGKMREIQEKYKTNSLQVKRGRKPWEGGENRSETFFKR